MDNRLHAQTTWVSEMLTISSAWNKVPISRTVQGALEQALVTLRPMNEVNVNFANEWVNMEIMKLVFSI